MAKKKREQTTRQMPSGAQQYVRPKEGELLPEMATIRDTIARRNSGGRELSRLAEAMLDESRRFSAARSNERQTIDEDRANRRKEGRAMKSKKTLAPAASKRPPPRPAGLAERADLRKAMDSSDAALRASKREAADREMGMKAGGKVKKMAMGGTCRGMGAATRGGNFSRG
jgi:hypothetical protein